jgi:hypothetical protein
MEDTVKKEKCPIQGCTFEYTYGHLGLWGHVGFTKNHPNYHPELTQPSARLNAFRQDFPTFFGATVSIDQHAKLQASFDKLQKELLALGKKISSTQMKKVG